MFFQKLDNILMHSLMGNVNGKSVHVILDITVSAVVKESSGSLVSTFTGCQEEWCFIFVILSIPVGTVSKEDIDSLCPTSNNH